MRLHANAWAQHKCSVPALKYWQPWRANFAPGLPPGLPPRLWFRKARLATGASSNGASAGRSRHSCASFAASVTGIGTGTWLTTTFAAGRHDQSRIRPVRLQTAPVARAERRSRRRSRSAARACEGYPRTCCSQLVRPHPPDPDSYTSGTRSNPQNPQNPQNPVLRVLKVPLHDRLSRRNSSHRGSLEPPWVDLISDRGSASQRPD
jgi:hypothetical protein